MIFEKRLLLNTLAVDTLETYPNVLQVYICLSQKTKRFDDKEQLKLESTVCNIYSVMYCNVHSTPPLFELVTEMILINMKTLIFV